MNDYSQAELKAIAHKNLKQRALATLEEATRLMHQYATDCELGREREKAFDVYENMRTATRVGP